MSGRRIALFGVGTSAGGVGALRELLASLPSDLRTPICIVHHLPANSGVNLPAVYPAEGREVVEAEDKMPIEDGKVYFAPGGYHLLVESDGQTFALSQDDPVQYSRPSIDVFFESAARALGQGVVGVLMTGANEDGAEGLRRVHNCGGITIVQDPEEAEHPVMPRAALKLFRPHHVVRLNEIGRLMREIERGAP